MTEHRAHAPAVSLSEGLAHPAGEPDDGTKRLVSIEEDKSAEHRRAPAVAPARDEWRRVKVGAGVAVGSAAIIAAALYAGSRGRKD